MSQEPDNLSATLTQIWTGEIPKHRPGRILLRAVGPGHSQDLRIEKRRLTVGTHPSADLQLNDAAVSRLHCELQVESKGVHLRDAASKNGTWIDGARVDSALLSVGASFRLGEYTVTLHAIEDVEVPVSTKGQFGALHGGGTKMGELFALLRRIAAVSVDVLVMGETGTGKDLIAQAIHDESTGREGPFVVVDCTALGSGVAEGTLFGHKKGAFTGAVADQAGLLEHADGGTVFLDEVGDLPAELQSKLLRALDQGATRRIGETHFRPFSARVVAATKQDIMRMVGRGEFRDDLYYRLSDVTIRVPPLRERGAADIGALADLFLHDCAQERGMPLRFAKDVYGRLAAEAWLGNVRQLRKLVRGAAMLADSEEITAEYLRPFLNDVPASEPAAPSSVMEALEMPWDDARREFERSYVDAMLSKTDGNKTEAAKLAGMNRSGFRKLHDRSKEPKESKD